MCTALTIDDPIAEALKKAAYESGKSFKQVVNDMNKPLSPEKAIDYVESWLRQPHVILLAPAAKHWPI